MGLSKDYRGIAKLNGGPGGWRCPCCNPYRCAPCRMKAKAHRLARRVGKAALRAVPVED